MARDQDAAARGSRAQTAPVSQESSVATRTLASGATRVLRATLATARAPDVGGDRSRAKTGRASGASSAATPTAATNADRAHAVIRATDDVMAADQCASPVNQIHAFGAWRVLIEIKAMSVVLARPGTGGTVNAVYRTGHHVETGRASRRWSASTPLTVLGVDLARRAIRATGHGTGAGASRRGRNAAPTTRAMPACPARTSGGPSSVVLVLSDLPATVCDAKISTRSVIILSDISRELLYITMKFDK